MAIHIATSGDHFDYVHQDLHMLLPPARIWNQKDLEMDPLFDHDLRNDNKHILCGDRPCPVSASAEAMESAVTWHMLDSPHGGCDRRLQRR